MSLWLAIGAGVTLCGTALFELVRTRGSSAVLVLAMLAGAAVAFSVAGLATKLEHKHHRAPATAGGYFTGDSASPYFSGDSGSSYDFTPAAP
jgi:hypothetical protein